MTSLNYAIRLYIYLKLFLYCFFRHKYFIINIDYRSLIVLVRCLIHGEMDGFKFNLMFRIVCTWQLGKDVDGLTSRGKKTDSIFYYEIFKEK